MNPLLERIVVDPNVCFGETTDSQFILQLSELIGATDGPTPRGSNRNDKWICQSFFNRLFAVRFLYKFVSYLNRNPIGELRICFNETHYVRQVLLPFAHSSLLVAICPYFALEYILNRCHFEVVS